MLPLRQQPERSSYTELHRRNYLDDNRRGAIEEINTRLRQDGLQNRNRTPKQFLSDQTHIIGDGIIKHIQSIPVVSDDRLVGDIILISEIVRGPDQPGSGAGEIHPRTLVKSAKRAGVKFDGSDAHEMTKLVYGRYLSTKKFAQKMRELAAKAE